MSRLHMDSKQCDCGGSGWTPGIPEDERCIFHGRRETMDKPEEIYIGVRDHKDRITVLVTDTEKIQVGHVTHPRLRHIPRHSPEGFEWGYNGSGPSDLALAILADALGEEPTVRETKLGYRTSGDIGAIYVSVRLYPAFRSDVIANLDRESSWQLSKSEVRDWIRKAMSSFTKSGARGA